MTRAQALRLARKKFGKAVELRDSGERLASSPLQREESRREFRRLMEAKPPRFEMNDREAYPDSMTLGEFRKLAAKAQTERAEWERAKNEAQSGQWRSRYGITDFSNGFCGHIVGSGDTWEEALHAAGALLED